MNQSDQGSVHKFQLGAKESVGLFPLPTESDAPSIRAGQMHRDVPAPTAYNRWSIVSVGHRWAAVHPWSGQIYWLRYFDSFQQAKEFVMKAAKALARMAVK